MLIPAVWLALGAFFVLVCVGAARADSAASATLRTAGNRSPAARRGSLVRLEDQPPSRDATLPRPTLISVRL